MNTRYVQYWLAKGAYGAERIKRAADRKAKRKLKPRRRWQFQCEMGYGDCERRGFCNGDC